MLIVWATREVFNEITCLYQLGITTHTDKSKTENKQALQFKANRNVADIIRSIFLTQ